MSSDEIIPKKKERAFSPSRTVWRTQMARGIYTPHRVSRITCVINSLLVDKVTDFLSKIGVDVFIEAGRTIREKVKPRSFGIPGNITKLQSASVSILRFTAPRENAKQLIEAVISIAELQTPGRGSIFSQDLMEFSKEPPEINSEFLDSVKIADDINLLDKLSYVTCVLSIPKSGEQLAKIALDLGICVPLLTSGTGNDIRDQLGLIRITIPAEKEIVHIVMPEQDSNSIIRLLSEQAHLDKPGRGFIYQTPVSMGLIDTRMKIGGQSYAASIEQIIAAIDSLKAGTSWRRRLDEETSSSNKAYLPQDNCEVSIISDEDRIDLLREACLKVGALGATTSRVIPCMAHANNEKQFSSMIRSAINIPAEKADEVVDTLLDITSIKEENVDRVNVLDSPAAYTH